MSAASADIRGFLSRVIPWPTDGHGYCNLHWKALNADEPDKFYWSGKPSQRVDDFIALAKWALDRPNIRDLYYCLSLQSQVKPSDRGRPGVARSRDNAISLKSLWLDIDIKEPPKGYQSLEEALDALQEFIRVTGLPGPSALVASGGGLHVYWISAATLTPQQWQPFADGLKNAAIKHGLRCDAGVTSDSARILRIPGTLNWKTEPPKPTKLLMLRPEAQDYDFAQSHTCLLALAPVSATVNPTFAKDPAFAKGPSTVFAALNPKEGVEHDESLPLSWEPLLQECAFIKEALRTGGKDYSQPMWNLSTLAATFLADGHVLAHKMGNLHAGYTPDSTEKLWERKLKERADRHLGWPSCAAIQSAGCTRCSACPHFGKGKSPLNFTVPAIPPVTATVTPAASQGSSSAMPLPKGYSLNRDGIVCFLHEEVLKSKDASPILHEIALFYSAFSKPRTLRNPERLEFWTTVDKVRQHKVSIRLGEIVPGNAMWTILQDQGVKPIPRWRDKAGEFFMAWFDKLHREKESLEAPSFGWVVEGTGQYVGFAYGGMVFRKDRKDTEAGFIDDRTAHMYAPAGDIAPWSKAMNELVIAQKRPELECIVALAFASPLLVFAGQYSGALSVWGQSAAQKSTAIRLGCAVWGHPRRTKNSGSTSNYVIEQVGAIKNLPLYWDEVRQKKDRLAVFNTIFSATEGVGKGRLSSDAKMKDKAEFQLLVCIAGNKSFVDFVASTQRDTDAGLFRLIEYEAKKPEKTDTGIINDLVADQMLAELEYNYGQIGMKYAELLGRDPDRVRKITKDILEDLQKAVDQQLAERFWERICGTILAGATLANEVGVGFDVPAMREFLIQMYASNRETREAEDTEAGSQSHTEHTLTAFLKDLLEHTAKTDKWYQDRPLPKWPTEICPCPKIYTGPIRLWSGPQSYAPRSVQVQWVTEDRWLRIDRRCLRKWLEQNDIGARGFVNGLKQNFNAVEYRGTLAGGTAYLCGREILVNIPIPPGSPLEDQLYSGTGATKPAPGVLGDPAAFKQAADQAAKDLEKVRGDTS